MKNSWFTPNLEFTGQDITNYLQSLKSSPLKIIALIVDIAIVLFIIVKLVKIIRETRAWQLIKGIVLLVVVTWLSGILNLNILNYILSAIMNWGVILIIVIFQPEIRRALEQLRNK